MQRSDWYWTGMLIEVDDESDYVDDVVIFSGEGYSNALRHNGV